jgi:hypothetical protein
MKISVNFDLTYEQLFLIEFCFQNKKIHRKEINYLIAMDLLREGILAKNSDHQIWLTNIGKRIYNNYIEQINGEQ